MPISRLSFYGAANCPALHLSVDGMSPHGPNLSHWPGNRTPKAWKADLSTGICLNFARASLPEQERFLAGADTVLNDHYDTDGFCSLLAVLRPELALEHEELLLAAAATGDFGTLGTPRAFALDRIVANLAGERSPYARDFAGLPGPERALARYRFLIEHAQALLEGTLSLESLWADEHARIAAEVRAARTGAMQRRLEHALGLAVLTTRSAVHRMTLNTLASAWRVLHVEIVSDGPLYRYHDRTESWFELVTIVPPPRRDLRPLAQRLQLLEEESARSAGKWCADAPSDPVPELYHGEQAEQAYGEVSRVRTPSALPPATVERELALFLAQLAS